MYILRQEEETSSCRLHKHEYIVGGGVLDAPTESAPTAAERDVRETLPYRFLI